VTRRTLVWLWSRYLDVRCHPANPLCEILELSFGGVIEDAHREELAPKRAHKILAVSGLLGDDRLK
jgi:hypothetical protein